jgi:hypothetical protein
MSTNNIIEIPVFSYKGNRNKKVIVGRINGDIYYSERRPCHFFRIFKGYGLGIDVYNFLIEHNVKIIRLGNEDKILDSEISQWKHSSRWDNEISKTHHIDPQYILEENKMRVLYSYELKGGTKMSNEIDFSKIGPIQGSGVDLTKYDKQTTTIEKAEVIQMSSKFTPLIPGTQVHYMQYVLKVSSVVLESIREGEDKIEFRASELFNLTQDSKGVLIGFPTSEAHKLMRFVKDLKIANPQSMNLQQLMDALKGKQVLIKSESVEKDGKMNTYLRFRY